MKNEFRTSRITVVRKYIKILFLRLHSNFGLSRDEGSGEKMRENKMARKCTKVLVSCICLHMINPPSNTFCTKILNPPYSTGFSKWLNNTIATLQFKKMWTLRDKSDSRFQRDCVSDFSSYFPSLYPFQFWLSLSNYSSYLSSLFRFVSDSLFALLVFVKTVTEEIIQSW